VTSTVTLAMVFVIQHTQSREQAATQRKLDELLRALPGAQTGLIMLEEASEEKMKQVEDGQRDLKRQRQHQ
jgi:low affinity Fe/Cu permease